jgi:hypothetical protein
MAKASDRVAVSTKRKTAPRNHWNRPTERREFGNERFRLWAYPKTGPLTKVSLDDVAVAFDWFEDNTHILAGSLTTMTSERGIAPRYDLKAGDVISCEVSPDSNGPWAEVWRMRVRKPQYNVGSGQTQYDLEDDLVHLDDTKGDFKYRKDKRHPKGWLGHEIIRDVAKDWGFEVTRLPKFRHRIKNLTRRNTSPLAIIRQILRYERTAYGTRYFLRWQNGGLAIVPFRHSRSLLLISGTIIDGTLEQDFPENFATELRVVGTRKSDNGVDHKGHKRRKRKHMEVTVYSKGAVRRYGRIVKHVTAPDHADSEADLIRYGKHQLARRAQPRREFTFTHPGIANLRRGDALRLTVPEANLERVIVFVKEVRHNVGQGNDYQMDVTVQFEDPYVDKESDKLAARCAKARERNRTLPKNCPARYRRRDKEPKGASKRRTAPAGTKRTGGS